jgi:hypothetical protein
MNIKLRNGVGGGDQGDHVLYSYVGSCKGSVLHKVAKRAFHTSSLPPFSARGACKSENQINAASPRNHVDKESHYG